MGTKIWDKKTSIVPISITPIEIAEKKVWQIWVGRDGGYFYVSLSEADNKIGIVGDKDGYLSGDYSEYIDAYKPGEPMLVKKIPLGGINCAFKWWEMVGFQMHRAKPSKTVEFKEFFYTV